MQGIKNDHYVPVPSSIHTVNPNRNNMNQNMQLNSTVKSYLVFTFAFLSSDFYLPKSSCIGWVDFIEYALAYHEELAQSLDLE